MVTAAPDVQNVGPLPTADSAPLRMKEVWLPGCRTKLLVSKVRGALGAGEPDGPPTDQVAGPPETMLQGAEQAGAVVAPVFVPANTTWQVDEVHVMGLPPLFLTEIDIASGDEVEEAPALRDAPTTATLWLDVALLTRL